MRRRLPCVAGALAFGAVLVVGRPAHALGPVNVEFAARIGSGTNPGWVANPYTLGFGGRAGASIYGFYGGISAIYYLGGSVGGAGGDIHSLLIGLEGGYTIKLPYVRLRPQVGVGDGNFTQSSGADGPLNPQLTTSVSNVYIEPSVVLMVPIGPLFLGVDAGAIILPGFTLGTPPGEPAATAKTYVSFTAHGQIGVFF